MKKITVLALLILSVIGLGSFPAEASGTVTIIGPSTIHKAKNSVLTTSDIISFYSSSMGEVAVSIDEYTGQGNIPGIYQLELYATDGINIESKIVEVNVIDTLPSKIKAIGDYKNIYTNTSSTLTQADIISALRITGFISVTDTTQMWILNNEYVDNEAVAGSYFYEFRLVDASGYDNTFSIKINVSNSGTLPDPDYVYTPAPGPLDHIWSITKNIVVFIGIVVGSYFLINFFNKKAKKVL